MQPRLAIVLDLQAPDEWESTVAHTRAGTPTPLLLLLDASASEDALRQADALATKVGGELRLTTTPAGIKDPTTQIEKKHAKRQMKELQRITRHLASVYRLATSHTPNTATFRNLQAEAVELGFDWDSINENARRTGEEERTLTQPLYDAASLHGANHPTTRQLLQDVTQDHPHLLRYAEQRRDEGAQNWLQRNGGTDPSEAPSRVRPSAIDHRINALPPAAAYTVYIDETGKDFSSGDNERDEGRIVAIVVPQGITLPPLRPTFHSVDESSADVDSAFQTLIDAPVGILGISLRASGLAGVGDRWANCVFQMMLWVQRYIALPPPPEHVQLHFVVEERGAIRASSDLNLTISQLQNSLVKENPARAKQLLPPKVEVVTKGDPLLPYADVVAYTWFAGSRASKHRLRQSGLLNRCLHGASLAVLENAYQIVTRARNPTPSEWRELLREPETIQAGSALNLALTELSDRVRENPSLWKGYLHETEAHLQSKAIEHHRLAVELAWLDRAAPTSSPLSPRLQLIRRSAELAQANHMGHGRFEHEAELRSLCDALVDEDQRLVCGADLRLAVMQTNRFAFYEANQELARWTDDKLQHLELQPRGRIYSSIGRHHAYLGDFERADYFFNRALAIFLRLTDKEIAVGEATHTGVYRALNALDRQSATRDSCLPFVEALLTPIPNAIERFAVSSDAADNYLHHLLLRFLAVFGTPDEVARYVALSPRWSRRSDGHPWGLIGLWRGILAYPHNQELAQAQLVESYAFLTRNPRATTLRFLGVTAAIATHSMLVEHAPAPDDLRRALDEIEDELPHAARRIQRLRESIDVPIDDPQALLAGILPFQFR